VTRLGTELEEVVALEAADGTEALSAALAGATGFGRSHACDVCSILAGGKGLARPACPKRRSCSTSPRRRSAALSATVRELPPKQCEPATAGQPRSCSRRFKLVTFRRVALERLCNARAYRWLPEELVRALAEAEVAVRDASMVAACLRAAGFLVKTDLGMSDGEVRS